VASRSTAIPHNENPSSSILLHLLLWMRNSNMRLRITHLLLMMVLFLSLLASSCVKFFLIFKF
jgi:hypothetical protein